MRRDLWDTDPDDPDGPLLSSHATDYGCLVDALYFVAAVVVSILLWELVR